jgi:hypothetical protein
MSRPGASIAVALVGSALIAAVGLCACGSTNHSGTVTNAASQVALARCMRSHGVPNFPDPTFPSGGAVKRSFPAGVVPSSPAFQRASNACGRGAQ